MNYRPEIRTTPNRALVVTMVALGVDMFLYGSLVPVLPSMAAIQGSALRAGALFAAYALSMLLAIPVIGRWVDRRGPRGPMLLGLVGLAVATVVFAAVVDVPGATGMTWLLAARIAQGFAAAASWTAGLAWIASTHPEGKRGRAMGLAFSAVGVGILVGPAVGGLLHDRVGPRAPFLLAAVLALLDAALRVAFVSRDSRRDAVPPVSARSLLGHPAAFLLVLLAGLGAAAIAFPEPVLPLHLSTLGLGSTVIGVAFTGAALAGSFAAPMAGWATDKLDAAPLAVLGLLVTACGLLLLGRDTTWVSISGLVLVSVGAQALLAPTLVLVGRLAESVRPTAYGAAYALYNLAYTGGLAAAPLLAGTLTAHFGLNRSAAGFVVLLNVATVLVAVAARRGRIGSRADAQQGG